MTHRAVPYIYPLFASALVGALAMFNWVLDPDDAMKWAISGMFLPLAWGTFELLLRKRPGIHEIRGSVLLAASLLTITLGFTVANTAGVLGIDGDDTARRAFGVAVGLVLVIIGNFIPKRMEPLLEKRCSPAQIQSLQRFGGWTFVIAGIGYAGTWLVLPVGPANTVSMIFAAGAIILVIGRWTLVSRGRS